MELVIILIMLNSCFQERLSHGISSGGFGGHNRSDFQPPYFPPPFPQQTAEQVFAAQAPHLSVGDPYSLNNSLHFQTSQVRHQESSSMAWATSQFVAGLTIKLCSPLTVVTHSSPSRVTAVCNFSEQSCCWLALHSYVRNTHAD